MHPTRARVVATRAGDEHRCAELFEPGDSRSACPNCRTLMHYVLGTPVEVPLDAATACAAAANADRPVDLYRVLDPLTPCLRPADAGARP